MKAKIHLLFLLLFAMSTAGAQISEQADPSVTFEPYFGINRISSSVESTRYYTDYVSTTKPGLFLGFNVTYAFPKGLTLTSGITFIRHNTRSDSLNIPPLENREIWSSMAFEYHSINLPLKIGRQINLNNFIRIQPGAALILNWNGGYDYTEIVHQDPYPYADEVTAASHHQFDNFSMALEGSLQINLLYHHRISPFIAVSYYASSLNFEFLRGHNSDSISAAQGGTVKNQGFLFYGGLAFRF